MSWTQSGYQAVARLIANRTGLTFGTRDDRAEVGIRRALARARLDNLDDYLLLLGRDENAWHDLIDELTVGETYFFREPRQFELIRRLVLPDLRRQRPCPHRLRTWSAGCASGEEAYSLAIVLEQEGWAAQVLATDISRRALARARQGVFGPWSLRGEGAAQALPFLIPLDRKYKPNARICRLVAFEYLNLALDVYPSFVSAAWGMDLILCRNVLIYFDRDTVAKVAQRLYAALAEGGWLITASSDPPLAELAPFETVLTKEGLLYRRCGEAKAEGGYSAQDSAVGEPLVCETPAAGSEFAGGMSVQTSEPEAAPGLSRGADEDAADEDTERLREAYAAQARGDYGLVIELTRKLVKDEAAAVLHLQALANRGPEEAKRACAGLLARHPLSAAIHFLHAVLLLESGQEEKAAQAARRVIYLDRTLAAAHFLLGSILRRRGDQAGAGRAYRNARDLCAARPAGDSVPLSEGETCGRLADAAAGQLLLLQAEEAS
jgi:chemotaxis protein methyltransferase CheR